MIGETRISHETARSKYPASCDATRNTSGGLSHFPTPAKILRANSPSTEILTAKAHSASNRPVFTSEIYGIETTRHRGTAKPYVGARVMGKVNLVRSCCTDHVQHVHYSFDWRYSSEERTLHGPRCTTFQDCGQPVGCCNGQEGTAALRFQPSDDAERAAGCRHCSRTLLQA
jgi:hypothetical protein